MARLHRYGAFGGGAAAGRARLAGCVPTPEAPGRRAPRSGPDSLPLQGERNAAPMSGSRCAMPLWQSMQVRSPVNR